MRSLFKGFSDTVFIVVLNKEQIFIIILGTLYLLVDFDLDEDQITLYDKVMQKIMKYFFLPLPTFREKLWVVVLDKLSYHHPRVIHFPRWIAAK